MVSVVFGDFIEMVSRLSVYASGRCVNADVNTLFPVRWLRNLVVFALVFFALHT